MDFRERDNISPPPLSALLDAERDVHALPFSEAFERSMVDRLAVRESHFVSSQAFRVSSDIAPPGLSEVFDSPANYVTDVDITLSLLSDATNQTTDISELRIALRINNTPYTFQTDFSQAALHYTNADGRDVTLARSPQDMIALVASLTLSVQANIEIDEFAPIRELGADRRQHAEIEQLLATLAKFRGQLSVSTIAIFEESEQKAIIAKLVETETPLSDSIDTMLDLDKVNLNQVGFIAAQLQQNITQRPVLEEQRSGIIQETFIPPADYPLMHLYGLADNSPLLKSEITPTTDGKAWQQLCYDFIQAIGPCMEPYRTLDESPFLDD